MIWLGNVYSRPLFWAVFGQGWSSVDPNDLVLTFRVFTSVPLFVKIDQEMRSWECGQTDRYTGARTDTREKCLIICTMLCYSYETDNKVRAASWHGGPFGALKFAMALILSTSFAHQKHHHHRLTFVLILQSYYYPNVTTLRSGLCCRQSVCLSVVYNVGAPDSGGWTFRQYFSTAVYLGHRPSSDFPAKFYGDCQRETPLSEALNTREVAKYSDFGPVESYIS